MNHKMTYNSIAASSFLILMIFANLAYAETCNNTARNTTPDSRYKVINNDEVKDLATGLIWQRCVIGRTWVNGQCTGQGDNFTTWQEALTAAKTKAGSTKKPYRLPSIKELQSLTHYGCEPALNTKYIGIGTDFFDNLSFQVWSSTPSTQTKEPFPTSGVVYTIDQASGEIGTTIKKTQSKYYARLVRSE